MSQSQSFISEYKVAPNPMAGVAGRMKAMGAMATSAGGGGSGMTAQMGSSLAGAQTSETLSEQNRAVTVLRGMQSVDAQAHQEKMTRARLDADAAGSIIGDIAYYGTVAKGVHMAADKVIGAMEGPGEAVVDDKTGEVSYIPGEAKGLAAGILKPLRSALNLIPGNRRSQEAREDLKQSTAEAGAMVEWEKKGVIQATQDHQDYVSSMEGLHHGLMGAIRPLFRYSTDPEVKAIEGNIEKMFQNMREGAYLDYTLGGLGSGPTDPVAQSKMLHPKLSKPEAEDKARAAAKAAGVPEDMFLGMVTQESQWDQYARSSAGAMGLAQVMPATAADHGVTDLLNPDDNLRAGASELARIRGAYGVKDERDQLIAYNWGIGNFRKWEKAGRDESKLPAETSQYIENVMGYRRQYQ